LPFDDLVDLVDAAPYVKSVAIGSEVIDVEIRIRWANPGRSAVRVEATAYGPSCWRLERLEESITVSSPHPSGSGSELEAIEHAARRDSEQTSGAATGRTHEEVMQSARRAIGCD
jgi:hypothetical protein